jgi:hypothetical protein
MRAAPLNVGTMIDKDRASMGTPLLTAPAGSKTFAYAPTARLAARGGTE